MGKFLTLSIRNQIIILVLVMAIVPIGIIVYSAAAQRNNSMDKARQSVERLADEIANDQNLLLSTTEQLLNALSYIPAVRSRDANAVSALLEELKANNPRINHLLMIDSNGKVWASAPPFSGVVMAEDRRYFKNAVATGKFASGEYTINRILHKPALTFGLPIKDSSGRITDVAAASFSLDRYSDLLKMKSIPENSTLSLVDHNGTILFNAHAPQLVGKKDRGDLFRMMAYGPDRGTAEGKGNLGTERIFAYNKLRLATESTPYLYVRAGIAKKPLLAAISRSLRINIGIMVSSLLLSVLLAIYISKKGILNKILSLRDAAERVAKGDLGVNVSDYVSGGEIGELGKAFDEMTRALILDQTERKEAEQALMKSEERYRLFSSLTTDYVHFCRRSGDGPFLVEWLGGAIEKITGYTEADIFALGCWLSIVHPEDIKRVKERLMNLKPGDTDSDEFRIVRKDGQVRWLLEAYRCHEGDKPGELVVFGASQDITRRRQQEQEIRILNGNLEHLVSIRTEELARINSELTSFCYAVSHELRAPIARLQGFSAALEEECPVDGNLPFLAERIGSASRKLQKVVDSILMLSRLSRTTLKREQTDLTVIAQRAAQKAVADLPEREVVCIIEPGMMVNADPTLLEICMDNLVGNAFKYSSLTPSARVEIGREQRGNRNVYYVKDNGAGFDMDYSNKLFTPFERLHQQDEFPGMGIGLATVQKIIERHGGELWAEGSVGDGATFYFTLES